MQKISIIVPAYNAQDFLHRCMNSIVAQTYKNLEIITVNDGSIDKTLHILQEYAQKDDRIKLISKENRGVSHTRNVGLENATGDFILFVDADDLIELNMVEHMLSLFAENEDIDIAVCECDNEEKCFETIKETDEILELWDSNREKLEFLMHKRMNGSLCNKLIRRSLFYGILFDETVGYGEDAQALWKVLQNSKYTIVTNKVLYHRVIVDTSISHQKFSQKRHSAIKVWQEISESVKKLCPKFLKISQERIASVAAYNYYEAKKSRYNNKEHLKEMKKLSNKYYFVLVTSKNITLKMKLYATAVKFCWFV